MIADQPELPIAIPGRLLAQLCRHAERCYPEEGCGLLIGRPAAECLEITDIIASANVSAASPRDSFEIDPALRLRLARQTRGGDATVVGHYHSHPDHPAMPSARDAAAVWEPELVWLIIAVARGVATDVRAFRFRPERRRFCQLALLTGL